MLAGCGGSNSNTPATAPPNAAPPPSSGEGSLNAPIVVSVNGAVTGVDIEVASPSGTAPNAKALGVASPSSSGGSADNTGAQIHRGATMHVLVFGPGLNGNLQVKLSGPQDYGISHQISITSTQNTPGIEFDLAVNGDAALGARTVILTDSNSNVTTFTGGLEVLP